MLSHRLSVKQLLLAQDGMLTELSAVEDIAEGVLDGVTIADAVHLATAVGQGITVGGKTIALSSDGASVVRRLFRYQKHIGRHMFGKKPFKMPEDEAERVVWRRLRRPCVQRSDESLSSRLGRIKKRER